MRVLLSIGVIFFVIAGCATTRAYEAELEGWKGRTEGELTQKWGKPAFAKELIDGGRTITYVRQSADPLVVRDPSSKKSVVLAGCRTTFLINREKLVAGWKYEGSNCRQ